MILYDVKCPSDHRFEITLTSMYDDTPACPACGSPTTRLPAGSGLSGRAAAGPTREQMPNTWQGIGRGDRETVRGWHGLMSTREKLEQKYPELAGDRRPVLAHEGAFAAAPLRAGDPLAASIARVTFGPPASSAASATTA
ncbi:MAG: zinc ribbon domain-containing protein [Rhodoglobus sp.]